MPRGRHYAPTPEQRKMVETMAGFGIPHEQIAPVVNCSPKTLRRCYREELDLGATKANASVAQSLFNRATKDQGSAAVTACIFWLKCRAGWREPPKELSGPGGGPIPVATINLADCNDEELTAIEKLSATYATIVERQQRQDARAESSRPPAP